MNIEIIAEFFFWCSVINGSLLLLWTGLMMFAPDLVYRTQFRWFPISQESFGEVMYRFIGLFKLLFLVFNLVPWLALKLMGG